jgi:hypothetical protein
MRPDYDPGNPEVRISLDCTRNGMRQTIHLLLRNKQAWEDLQAEILLGEGVIPITLANEQVILLDSDSIWLAYRLGNSYSCPGDTISLGVYDE